MNHITKLRKDAGFRTANEFREALNVSISTIRKIEASYRKPSLKLAHKMIQIFGCKLEDIFLPCEFTNSELEQNTNNN